jgi:hypothetical protein
MGIAAGFRFKYENACHRVSIREMHNAVLTLEVGGLVTKEHCKFSVTEKGERMMISLQTRGDRP